MRSGVGVAAAAVLAAVLIVLSGGALAETEADGPDAPPGVPADGASAEEAARDPLLGDLTGRALGGAGDGAARFLLFSTSDLWRQGGFSHGGVLWSPEGLDREGVVVKLMFGGGLYRYVSGALGNAQVIGGQLSAAILPGWRFARRGLMVTVFAGPEIQSHKLVPNDPSAGLRGQYTGARAGFNLWYEPTATTMIAADASISTIGVSYNARLAADVKLLEWFYLGPEAQAFAASGNYRQVRAGSVLWRNNTAPACI